ncbi:TIGR03619 family F420-dependent LLM class oxidoreductase [Nocardia stercoris]|uniref:TIGR03619 family F420-dependent LLM class oxidoreductase n=1 Tax=Nocardia stercoris TaxID=2483361 RepID=A0A3M2L6S7_9NOCA|nr:TIGR03619 family F420-dependent LLM class oxidoreductase [Nocardia stercoris]RMI33422.1 TIGR03619 family F420-dependent LLM class oxidoreductase [Nocardia stercoris]
MRFAVSYSTAFNGTDPDRLLAFARHAENLGFEALYVQDHIALYPGADYGSGELPATLPYFDPLDCLSFVAAATSRILLGTGVLLLPYRHPVVLAKRLATVDVLSGGRMRLLTVGLGALPGEAHALGVDFRSRGRRADEAIDVLRLLWAGGPEGISHHGEFFAFDNLCTYPHPHETPTLPIHIGGSSAAAARRAGLRGDGYFAGGMLTEHERDRQIDLARKTAVEAGRDPAELEYTRWGSADMSPERVAELTAHGVDRLVVGFAGFDPAEQHDQMSEFAERFSLPRR